MKLLKAFIKEKKQEEEIVEKKDTVLYILSDIQKSGLITYLNSNNISIKKCTSDIDDIFLVLTMSENVAYRLVVIDYGSGKYKLTENIDRLVGLLESNCDPKNNKNVTVFTRNGVLRQTLRKAEIKCDTYEYSTVSDVIQRLKEYNEVYTQGDEKETVEIKSDDLLKFKPPKIEFKYNSRLVRIHNRVRDLTNLNPMDTLGGDSLQQFQCRF